MEHAGDGRYVTRAGAEHVYATMYRNAIFFFQIERHENSLHLSCRFPSHDTRNLFNFSPPAARYCKDTASISSGIIIGSDEASKKSMAYS